jgi:DNA-binding transcriptional LysR family regulator
MSFTAALRDLNKLNTFVRVAQRRSFTKAAAELRTTPSVISKRMKELEEALGFSLLSRSTHGLALTEAGEGLFQQCLGMLAKLDEYVTERRNIETGPFGTLRVQATNDYARVILAPLTTRFVNSRPGIRVHLSAVPEHFISGEDGFDIIVSSQKPSLPGVVAHDLGAVRHVICGSPDYFQKSGRPKTPQDLRTHNCLVDLYSGPKNWPFQNSPRLLLVEVKGSLSSDSNAVLIRMALDGSGVIRVPHHAVAAEIRDKEARGDLQERVAVAGTHVCVLRQSEASAGEDRGFHRFPGNVATSSRRRLKLGNDLLQLLFGFSGRVNRAKYWLTLPSILFPYAI